MKKQKLISGVITALVYLLLSFTVSAQDKNLNKNNNLNKTNPDSINGINQRSPQSDEDVKKMPMNKMDNPDQTPMPGKNSSLNKNNPGQTTPPGANKNIQDSTKMHRASKTGTLPDSKQQLNAVPKQRQDLAPPRSTSKTSIKSKNKNMLLVPDSTLKK